MVIGLAAFRRYFSVVGCRCKKVYSHDYQSIFVFKNRLIYIDFSFAPFTPLSPLPLCPIHHLPPLSPFLILFFVDVSLCSLSLPLYQCSRSLPAPPTSVSLLIFLYPLLSPLLRYLFLSLCKHFRVMLEDNFLFFNLR